MIQSPSKISIVDLEVFYCVGVPDAERAEPQRLLLSVEMETDFTRAATTDDLTATIDYYAVAQRLLKLGEARNWRLIEKLANDIAEIVLKEFKAAAVTVEVKKFIIPQTRFVSVQIRKTG